MYTLAMAKEDYRNDWIKSFSFNRTDNGWTVVFMQEAQEPTIKRSLSTARSSSPRVFKTLDAAIATVEEIGFSVDYLTRE